MEISHRQREQIVANLTRVLDDLAAQPGDQLIDWAPGESNSTYYLATDTDAPIAFFGARSHAVAEAETSKAAGGVLRLFTDDGLALHDVVARFEGAADAQRLGEAISRAFTDAGVRSTGRGEFAVSVAD